MRVLAALMLALFPFAAHAQTSDLDPVTGALEAARAAATAGQGEQTLAGHGTLRLPDGMKLVPTPESKRLMAAMGKPTSEALVGLVIPDGNGHDLPWLIGIEHFAPGFVPTEVARTWTPDDIMKNLRIGATRGHVHRAHHAGARLGISGWVEPPIYDPGTHRLLAATHVVDVGPSDASNFDSVNIGAYVFGRRGFLRLTLAGAVEDYDSHRERITALLRAVGFPEGQRAEDFVPGKDAAIEDPLLVVFAGFAPAEAKSIRLTQMGTGRNGGEGFAADILGMFGQGAEDNHDLLWMAGLLGLVTVIGLGWVLFGRINDGPSREEVSRMLVERASRTRR